MMDQANDTACRHGIGAAVEGGESKPVDNRRRSRRQRIERGGSECNCDIIGRRMTPGQFDRTHLVAARAQAPDHAAVVGVAAGDGVERGGNDERDLYQRMGPSYAAQASGLSRSSTFSPASERPASPSAPSRQARASSV